LQRYGISLQQLVQKLAWQHRVQGITAADEAWGLVNVLLTDMKHDEKSSKTIDRMVKSGAANGALKLGPRHGEAQQVEVETGVLVLASGNLGLVYGTNREERLTLEEMETLYPGMLEGLAQHAGIGFVMINSAAHGAVVVGNEGRAYLDEDVVEGVDPLCDFGPNAAGHLRRYNEFENAPDLYINSFYNAETNEVAAFEELIGCHGGMGGYQTRPFVLYPAELKLDYDPLVGAAAVYQQFKSWLAQLQGASRITKGKYMEYENV
jgi:hypothetical protein